MMPKLGFVFLILLFGASMLAAGSFAPPSVNAAIASAGARALSIVPGPAAAPAATPAAPAPGASASASASASAPPIPAASLLLTTPLPAKAQFALEAGRFASAAPAAELGVRVAAAKLPFAGVINIVDADGMNWFVVPIGPFATADLARAARVPALQGLADATALPLMLFPAAVPPP